MNEVIADTHALVWYVIDRGKLSAEAYTAMKQAEDTGQIYIPFIVLVELRYLVEKRTITETVFQIIADAIADPDSALTLLPLDFDCARAVGNIARATVPDMPDRIIAATASVAGFPLVTRDHKITAAGIHTIW
jgi:PIN domain nuclease of toxin-antitoxin system